MSSPGEFLTGAGADSSGAPDAVLAMLPGTCSGRWVSIGDSRSQQRPTSGVLPLPADAGFPTTVAVTVVAPGVLCIRPFLARIEAEDDVVTLHHPDTEVFGSGPTLSDARRDFAEAALELFGVLALENSAGRLGPHTEAQLAALRRHLTHAPQCP